MSRICAVPDAESDYRDYDVWLTIVAEAFERFDALQRAVTEIRHLCEDGAVDTERVLEVLAASRV